jgi:hypothetical protein
LFAKVAECTSAGGIGQPGCKAPPHFFVRNHLNLARIDLFDTALDLFGPGSFDAFVGRSLIEAFEKRSGNGGASFVRQS